MPSLNTDKLLSNAKKEEEIILKYEKLINILPKSYFQNHIEFKADAIVAAIAEHIDISNNMPRVIRQIHSEFAILTKFLLDSWSQCRAEETGFLKSLALWHFFHKKLTMSYHPSRSTAATWFKENYKEERKENLSKINQIIVELSRKSISKPNVALIGSPGFFYDSYRHFNRGLPDYCGNSNKTLIANAFTKDLVRSEENLWNLCLELNGIENAAGLTCYGNEMGLLGISAWENVYQNAPNDPVHISVPMKKGVDEIISQINKSNKKKRFVRGDLAYIRTDKLRKNERHDIFNLLAHLVLYNSQLEKFRFQINKDFVEMCIILENDINMPPLPFQGDMQWYEVFMLTLNCRAYINGSNLKSIGG